MRPMLDDIELPHVQEITSQDKRALAEHKPPGMEGSLLQNMGRRPTRIILGGVKTGADSLEFLETLDDKFKQGKPLPFIADIIADAEIEEMVVADLKWQELAGKPHRYAYVLVLREYLEPAEAEDTALLNNDILGDADGLIDDLVDGLDIGLDLATGLEQFVSPLSDLLVRLQRFRQAVDQANGK